MTSAPAHEVARSEVPRFEGRRTIALALSLGAVGLALSGIGGAIDPQRAAFSWLMSFAFVTSTAIGALVLLAISYAVNARWVAVVRRLNECITLAFVPLALAFVPIVLSAEHLYLWADPAVAELSPHERHLLEHKGAYLNVTFFAARAAGFFTVFIACAELLRRWSVRRDTASGELSGADAAAGQGRFRLLSSAALPLIALSLTFAAFDWLMSLEPLWFSTMYGVYVFAGGFLAALALLTLLAYITGRSGKLPELSSHHFHALGRLLFAFTIFWAYAGFFQALLIKIAGKPAEATYYLRRSEADWSVVLWLLVVGHFVVPFFVLLPRGIKFRGRILAAVAAWLLLMHLVDVYWLVLPAMDSDRVSVHWLDVSALVGLGGVTVAFSAWRQRGKPLLTIGDPFLPAGVEYRSR